MDIIDSVVDFLVFFFFFSAFIMTAFLSDTPTCLRPSSLLSFRSWGRKRATIARCVEKTCGLDQLALMGSFDMYVCVWAYQFRIACFLHRFCSHFFSFLRRGKKGLGFVHQIDFMSCGIYGRDVSTMSVSFYGFRRFYRLSKRFNCWDGDGSE